MRGVKKLEKKGGAVNTGGGGVFIKEVGQETFGNYETPNKGIAFKYLFQNGQCNSKIMKRYCLLYNVNVALLALPAFTAVHRTSSGSNLPSTTAPSNKGPNGGICIAKIKTYITTTGDIALTESTKDIHMTSWTIYVVLYAIWCHSYNLKNVKNTHGGVLFY